MKQRIIALLLLSTVALQATNPLPPHLFNCGIFNNINLSIHKLPKVSFNTPQFATITKQSTAFIRNNYAYIASFVALAFGLGWWYQRTGLKYATTDLQTFRDLNGKQAGTILSQQQQLAITAKNNKTQADIILNLQGQLAIAANREAELQQNAIGLQEELDQLHTFEETWQQMKDDKLQQLAFLRTFFNSDPEQWLPTTNHSEEPLQFIKQACSKKPSRKPHIIYFCDRPVFCISASIQRQKKRLRLDINYVADPMLRNLRVTIIPRYNIPKTSALAKMFANEIEAINDNVTQAHLQGNTYVKIKLPTLFGPQNFNLHAASALSNFETGLDGILDLEDHSQACSHSN